MLWALCPGVAACCKSRPGVHKPPQAHKPTHLVLITHSSRGLFPCPPHPTPPAVGHFPESTAALLLATCLPLPVICEPLLPPSPPLNALPLPSSPGRCGGNPKAALGIWPLWAAWRPPPSSGKHVTCLQRAPHDHRGTSVPQPASGELSLEAQPSCWSTAHWKVTANLSPQLCRQRLQPSSREVLAHLPHLGGVSVNRVLAKTVCQVPHGILRVTTPPSQVLHSVQPVKR